MSEAENKRKKRHRSSQSGSHASHTGHSGSGRHHSSHSSGHSSRKKSRSKPNKLSVLSVVIDILLLVVMAAFDVVLAMTQLLPMKFLALIYVLLLGVVMGVIILVDKPGKKGRFYTGITIGIIITIIMLIGIFAMAKGLSTVNDMTGNNTETAHVGVYVKTGDPAQSLEEASSYTFGIMDVLDRENVEHSLEEINSTLNMQIATYEYSGLSELINGLYADEVGAILLNDAYLDVLADTEEFAAIESDIRELTQIKVETVIDKAENSQQENEDDNTITIFISGIDSRNGLAAKSRSDVNILATINTETRQVLLVSTPRDYFVPLSISNGAPDKLTHAGIYGVDVSMDTIGMLYDIDVDYYFRVNFGGFEKIIDSLGGITVNSDFAFTSYFGSYKFNKGENYVNGAQALAFARERYAFSEGDRQRGKNHMAIIQGVINKALSPDILKNYLPLMDAVSGSFEMSVPYDLIASIVREQLQNGGGWNIVSYSVNGTGANKVPYSMSSAVYVMIPDQTTVDTAIGLIKQVENGETITAP